MQRKLIGQFVFILLLVSLFAGLLIYRYYRGVEVPREKLKTVEEVKEDGTKVKRVRKTTEKVRVKKFPINLGLDLQGGVHFLVEAGTGGVEVREIGARGEVALPLWLLGGAACCGEGQGGGGDEGNGRDVALHVQDFYQIFPMGENLLPLGPRRPQHGTRVLRSQG